MARFWLSIVLTAILLQAMWAPLVSAQTDTDPQTDASDTVAEAPDAVVLGTARLPPTSDPIPANYFGMHIHDATTTTAWPNVNFGVWRLWDAHVAWPYLEPRKGDWHFDTLDASVNLATLHGQQVLLPLALTPTWASARPTEASPYFPGAAAEPRDLQDWRTYVRTVAERYRGRIYAYEIWNEPDHHFFYTGTVPEMVELARQAYLIIKSVDPNAVVVSPAPHGDGSSLDWLSNYLSLGGGQYADAIGYHLYVHPRPPEAIVDLAGRVHGIMAQRGVGNLPLWNTEFGWLPPTQFSSDADQAAYVARSYILNWAAGVRQADFYAWDEHDSTTLFLTRPDSGAPTAAATAYQTVEAWLVQSRLGACSVDQDQTWNCALRRGDGTQAWIVWNANGSASLTPPAAWSIIEVDTLNGIRRPYQGGPLDVSGSPQLMQSAAPAVNADMPGLMSPPSAG